MTSTNLKPKWWQLYLTFPLLIALFVLDARLSLSIRGHEAVQVGIVMLVYGLIHFWIKANSRAFIRSYMHDESGRVIVIRMSTYRISAPDKPQLPNSEIHGVLGDTFEMDVIDAKFLPEDKVLENVKQE
jgi:hypothetical protein